MAESGVSELPWLTAEARAVAKECAGLLRDGLVLEEHMHKLWSESATIGDANDRLTTAFEQIAVGGCILLPVAT